MMDKLEKMKKASKLIANIGKVFQIVSGIITGIFLVSIILLSVLRNSFNGMTVVFQTGFTADNMGYWAAKLADEGRISDAFLVFGISALLLSLVITLIMHFVVKIFTRFCNEYSPFLPETIKDLKIISLLATLLILRNSFGLGLISGFIFWGIIQLYEYGCELQNQADETL